eukprot:SAG31_NODE_214_length_20084_cov_2.644684_10_plen_191_part_00
MTSVLPSILSHVRLTVVYVCCQMQLFGHKAVTLIAPHHAACLGSSIVTPFLHTTKILLGETPPGGTQPVTVVLHAGEMLYLPAGWFHSTEARYNDDLETEAAGTEQRQNLHAERAQNKECEDQKYCRLSGSVNFFLSACFTAVGVIVPQLNQSDASDSWLGSPPPSMQVRPTADCAKDQQELMELAAAID